MKQYEKIYVYIDINEEPAYDFLSNGTGAESALGVRENCIVLTLEELREVFDAGSNYVYLDVPHNQNFEQFLKSKGIQL